MEFRYFGPLRIEAEPDYGFRPITTDGVPLRGTWENCKAIGATPIFQIVNGKNVLGVYLTREKINISLRPITTNGREAGITYDTWNGSQGTWAPLGVAEFLAAVYHLAERPAHLISLEGIILDGLLADDYVLAHVMHDMREEYEFCSGGDLDDWLFEHAARSLTGEAIVRSEDALAFIYKCVFALKANNLPREEN